MESDINAALDGLTFTPNANFNGADTLNITTAVAADLVGHYTFESGTVSGLTVNDQATGTAYDGFLNGDAAIVNDAERGDVLSLDGDNDFLYIEDLIGQPANVTLSGWIDATSVDTFGGVVISLGTSPAIFLNNAGQLEGYYESGGTNNVVTGTKNLVGTGWRHVALTIDDATRELSVYLDGKLIGTLIGNGPIEYDNSPHTYIGRDGTGSSGFDFNGLIDDARIYSRALSAEEIAALATDQTEVTDSVAITVDAVNDAPEFVQPELISNGGFTTDLAAWTTTGTVDLSGSSLRFGSGNAVGPHTASQTISTIAGATYELTFDYRDGRTDFNQSLQVTVDGAANLLTTPQIITDVAGDTYVRYTYSFTADSDSATVTFTDTSDTAGVADGTNTVDGHIDNVSVRYQSGVMSEVTFVEGGSPVVLDADVGIFDVELSGLDNFNETTLYIGRNGGANAEDTFSATGLLGPLTEGGNLIYNSLIIGTVNQNSGGELVLQFNSAATNTLVNSVMQSIAYSNSSDTPPSSADLNWTFNDVNNGDTQGSGGAQWTSGRTIVDIQAAPDLAITAPATSTTSEDTAIVYSGANVIQVDDGLAADSLIQVKLSVANGTLTLSGNTGVTFVEGADGSGNMVIEGLESDINAALDGLTFTPNTDYNGADTLNITTAVAADLEGHYTFEGSNAKRTKARVPHKMACFLVLARRSLISAEHVARCLISMEVATTSPSLPTLAILRTRHWLAGSTSMEQATDSTRSLKLAESSRSRTMPQLKLSTALSTTARIGKTSATPSI